MSINQASVTAFVKLLESDIIPQSEITKFYQLNRKLQEDDEIVTAIETWLKHPSRSQLLASYQENLKILLSESNVAQVETIPGNVKSPTKPNQPSETVSQLFHNAMIKVTQTTNSGNIQSQPPTP
ncbi:MAG TPA: hypothetical protein DEG17_08175 [Cyanobacteria bacterium UBA11149]|nr:hypothetical protein [Cyanobacteria bacterium UBA11367]HBE61096.1 hypothetical protein [Cyanobacteria bacterium UBA11366]HBK65711.1 hypothetical protein [Cyanobacteria bacterium UBA11166]HBR75956.1 hypothetical protein [Cyanobacteria bacterium UBA11159]HBS72238.1 hypothetical protein [Cyanobacteria bacterium UBA11153]HBW88836.1 hypothetical protein [Cyanobacteria bacterium UBA11149]HCA96312.1 hypothetical protein [Cyanobacteria bacterium UBA9226]